MLRQLSSSYEIAKVREGIVVLYPALQFPAEFRILYDQLQSVFQQELGQVAGSPDKLAVQMESARKFEILEEISRGVSPCQGIRGCSICWKVTQRDNPLAYALVEPGSSLGGSGQAIGPHLLEDEKQAQEAERDADDRLPGRDCFKHRVFHLSKWPKCEIQEAGARKCYHAFHDVISCTLSQDCNGIYA